MTDKEPIANQQLESQEQAEQEGSVVREKPAPSEVRMPRTISPMGMFFGSGAKMPYEKGYDPHEDEAVNAMFGAMRGKRPGEEGWKPQKPHTVRNLVAAVIVVAILYLITMIIK